MTNNFTQIVRERASDLFTKMSMKKGKLGEVLGAKGTMQNKIAVATRFLDLSNTYPVTVAQVSALADFFGRPVDYFLGNDAAVGLASPTPATTKGKTGKAEKALEDLRAAGVDEAVIQSIAKQLGK